MNRAALFMPLLVIFICVTYFYSFVKGDNVCTPIPAIDECGNPTTYWNKNIKTSSPCVSTDTSTVPRNS